MRTLATIEVGTDRNSAVILSGNANPSKKPRRRLPLRARPSV